MIKKSKKNIGAFLVAAFALSSAAGFTQSINDIKLVSAATKEGSSAVNSKLQHLIGSLKKNYLGVKNVPQWEKYIKEARSLNSKLPSGEEKNKYDQIINSAESLVNAASNVNKLEFSLKEKESTEKSIPEWEGYIDLASEALEKVDTDEFEIEYDTLMSRLENGIIKIHEITGITVKVESAVVEEATSNKITVKFSEGVKSNDSDVKAGIAVKSDEKDLEITSAVISEDGTTITITLAKGISKGQAVTVTLKEEGSVEDKFGNFVSTDIKVTNNVTTAASQEQENKPEQGEEALSFVDATLVAGGSVKNSTTVSADAEFKLSFDRGISVDETFENNKKHISIKAENEENVAIKVYRVEGSDDEKKNIYFKPEAPLAKGKTYKITVSGDFIAKNGKKLGNPITITFTTAK